MRDVIPYIFWPWFGLSCFILLRRRVSHGSWRAAAPAETPAPTSFVPPPRSAAPLPTPSTLGQPVAATTPGATAPAAVMTAVDPDRPRARSLAEAVEGIHMPCDLAPLMGAGAPDPRAVSFFTHGNAPADVGSALADELERLGYEITPLDECSIRADRGADRIEVRLLSNDLTSEAVMQELHPSAPTDALVVDLKLT